MNNKNKRTVTILSIFIIMITLVGGTFAYWMWVTDVNQHTGVAFTIDKQFSCSADGGQDLTSTNIKLQPTSDCTNPEYALQRTIKVTPEIKGSGLSINLDMWLKVNDIDPELAASDNLMYAISTAPGSCKPGMEGHVTSGNFRGLTTDDQATLLKNKTYTATTTDTYYLYIWLDAAETNSNTMDKSFDLSLGGICTDVPAPEAPVLDKGGMIPVTISEDGVVTTIAENDPNWYNYDNKEWANMVLVNTNATANVEGSQPRSYYLDNLSNNVEVNQSDILAYYVWIPRYKYKMSQTKCSDIPENERNIEDYPECYAPYTLTDDEKKELIKYWEDDAFCAEEYWGEPTNNESIKVIELGLSTGRLSNGESILSYIEGYNTTLTEDGIYWCSEEEMTGSEITLTPSEFNGNITYPTREGTIDIVFEPASESMSLGNATTEYRTHPSFWWDDDSDSIVDDNELISGIWVGKFETTPDKNSTCYTKLEATDPAIYCDNSTQNPTILPNERSLRNQDVDNQFKTSRNISKEGNIYGLDNNSVNAHMMKNSDWGAVAYLSHSVYGINQEIYINNSEDFYTGRSSGDNLSSSSNKYGTYTWLGQTLDSNGNPNGYAADRTLGTNASTTGNITGVHDMSGGSYEYVMGSYNGEYYEGKITGDGVKYYDLYSSEDFLGTAYGNLAYCTIDTCGGHALNETAGWYNDDAYFVDANYPLFMRGGMYDEGKRGGLFWVMQDGGWGDKHRSWRSVLVPGFSH